MLRNQLGSHIKEEGFIFVPQELFQQKPFPFQFQWNLLKSYSAKIQLEQHRRVPALPTNYYTVVNSLSNLRMWKCLKCSNSSSQLFHATNYEYDYRSWTLITSPGVPKFIGNFPLDPTTAIKATNETANAANNWKNHRLLDIYCIFRMSPSK